MQQLAIENRNANERKKLQSTKTEYLATQHLLLFDFSDISKSKLEQIKT